MPLYLNDLREIIDARAFDRLIGEAENQFFDAKSQPYQFDSGQDSKREFAKDVSAFANADGGYILVGIATARSTLHVGDQVTELRPMSDSLFDPDRHLKLLVEWLYPLPIGIDIRFHQFGSDLAKGIGVIFVPPQDERSKPFLITRTIGDKKSTELLVGYAERHRDQTQVRTVREIHQALRTGLNLGEELLGRMANIEVLVERHFSSKAQAETAERRERLLDERIARLLEEDKAEL